MSKKNLLQGISNATRHLLDENSQTKAIQLAVSALGEGAGVDRCYIFQIVKEEGKRYLSQRFEWVKDHISVQIDNPRLQMLPEELFPWLLEKLDRDENLFGIVKESDDLNFKDAMEEQEIKTYLFTPIQFQGEAWGFIGYDDCAEERPWQKEEVDALATVAKTIGIRLGWDRTKADLIEKNELFELALQGAKLGMWDWNPATNEAHASKKYLSILGYQSPNQLQPFNFETWAAHVHPADVEGVKAVLFDYMNNRRSDYEVKYRIYRRDGELRWIQGNGMAKRDANGVPLVLTGFIQDVTDKVLSEQSIQESVNKSRELNELKSSFVSMASHQFRTPLTVIYSNIELMEMMLPSLSGTGVNSVLRAMARIKNEVERMTELMNNILTFGKYEAGLMSIRFEPLLLSELIYRLNDQYFSNEADRRTFEIHIHGHEKEVHGDSLLLSHAFSNLMSNAMKYSPGKPNPQICFHFEEDHVRVKVIDFGIGIPEKEKPKLFNSFFRASNASTFVGSGLGLPIVKEFVERHGGELHFESEENKGSVFEVLLNYGNAQGGID